jgi:hypothetical protein
MKQAREERETLRRYEQQRRDTGDVRLPYACHSLILLFSFRPKELDTLTSSNARPLSALPSPFLSASSYGPPSDHPTPSRHAFLPARDRLPRSFPPRSFFLQFHQPQQQQQQRLLVLLIRRPFLLVSLPIAVLPWVSESWHA